MQKVRRRLCGPTHCAVWQEDQRPPRGHQGVTKGVSHKSSGQETCFSAMALALAVTGREENETRRSPEFAQRPWWA